MKYNKIFNMAFLVIENQLNRYGNTIRNYDSIYKIIDDNKIKVTLKNYYEKMFFYAELKNNVVEVFSSDNNYINCKLLK
jgi:hypothetical protein